MFGSLRNGERVVVIRVTRLGDILDFGEVFKAFGNNYFAQISHILRHFVNVSKSVIFLILSFLGKFYRHLAIFSGHAGCYAQNDENYYSTYKDQNKARI